MKRLLVLIGGLVLFAGTANATITTVKTLVVQTQNDQGVWADNSGYGYGTASERTSQIVVAKTDAKSVGGRIVQRIETWDDKDTIADETDDTYTIENKIVLMRVSTPIAITANANVWSRVLKTLPSDPWADTLKSAIKSGLAAD